MFACFFLNLNDFIPFRLGEGQFNFSERTIPRSRAAKSSKPNWPTYLLLM